MKITKKIDNLLKRRTRLAEDLLKVSMELDQLIESHGGDLTDSTISDAVLSGTMIYCEPSAAEECVRDYLGYLE